MPHLWNMIPSFLLFIFLYIMSFVLVMSGEDWFMVWMGLEINMLSFIVLVYKRFDCNCIESCLSYFFVQSLGSAIFMSLFYLDKEVLSNVIIMVLSYKVGAAPFYFWFPSVCSGMSWLSCFVLMIFQKILPLMLVVVFVGWIIWMIIMLSLVFGAYGSFNQSNIKQLFAYSSIHHLGWIFLCNMFSDSVWILYLLLYSMIVFGVVMVMSSEEVNYFFLMNSWKGKWWFVVGMLSMAGMPPLLGFFLKWMAFLYIMKMNLFFVMLMVIMSVIMFYVYFRVIYDVFMCFSIGSCYLNYLSKIMFKYEIDFVGMMGLLSGLVFIIILLI